MQLQTYFLISTPSFYSNFSHINHLLNADKPNLSQKQSNKIINLKRTYDNKIKNIDMLLLLLLGLQMTDKIQQRRTIVFTTGKCAVMGCNQVKSDEPKQDCTFTEKQYLQYMLEYIQKNEELGVVLDKQLFHDLKGELNNMCWPYENKASLARLLQDYIRFSIQQTYKGVDKKITRYNLQEFGRQFGEEVQVVRKSVDKKNRGILQTLQLYKNIKQLYFPLSASTEQQKKKIHDTIQQLNKACEQCEDSYFYLSLILVKGCRQLQSKRYSMKQINSKLTQVIQFINSDFINTPQTEHEQHTMLIYHQIKADEYEMYPSQLMDTGFKYRQAKLSGQEGENREEVFENQIMEMVEESKKEFQYFERLMHNIVKPHRGFGFKVNFKIKYREDTEALERIKEKILLKQIKDLHVDQQMNYPSIDELRKKEKEKRHAQMDKILSSEQQISLQISDILRGKCIFKSLQDVNQTAKEIFIKVEKQKAKKVDIQVLAIQNRLKKITNDLVFKIRIRKTVAQFQLVFCGRELQVFKNQVYHKVYEISRSKFLSSISMLFNWHQKIGTSYIKFLIKVVQHGRINVTSEQRKLLESLKNDKNVSYLLAGQPQGGTEKIALKNDIVSILIADKIIDSNKVEKVKQGTLQRTAEFYEKTQQIDKYLTYANKIYQMYGQKKDEPKKKQLQKKITLAEEKLKQSMIKTV